jgi:putative ABC transport system permease protein
MRSVIVRGFLTRKLRSALTAIAILLGVAMISGTFVLTDKINAAFNDIFASGNENISVVVSQEARFSSDDSASNYVAFDESVADTIRGLPGVATVAPEIQVQGFLVRGDEKLRPPSNGAPPLVFTATPPDLTAFTVQEGAMPSESGQVAVLEDQAKDDHIAVGDQLQLSTDSGLHPVTVSGILKFGDVSSIGGATVTVMTFQDAQQWFNLQGKTSLINVRSDGSVSDEQLATEVRQAVPPDLTVRTGQEQADKDASDIAEAISFLNYLLLAFGFVAVFVGAFIIFNTYTITVAQRTREFGMLRTIGASRRQVLGAVLGEALIVGIIATILGFAGGILFAAGLTALFDAVGFGIPATGTPIELRTVIWAVAVGLGVTVLAAMIPAVRATRVAPIQALREGHSAKKRRRPWIRPLIAVIVFALSGFLLYYGVAGEGDIVTRLLLGVAGGAILFFIGVALIATYLVRPVVAVVGVLVGRFGASGKLAMENTTRNTGRTAVTAAALMIGVGLVVFVTILFTGLKDSFAGAVDRSVRGDLIVSSETFGVGLPAETVPAIEGVNGVGFASPIGVLPARFDGSFTNALIGVDTERLSDVYRFDWVNGDDALLGQLGANGALVEKDIAESQNLAPGDTLRAESQSGATTELKVLGTFEDPNLLNGIVVSNDALKPVLPPGNSGINYIFVKFDDGANADAVQADVENALKQFPIAKVQSNQELKDEVEGQVDQVLFIFYALLAMSVIISLFGIVNTLVLSVYERTREIGMLRAIGTTRRQLRRMIRYESVITAVLGGLLGVAVGIVFGYVMSTALEDEGLSFVLPIGPIIIFMIVAIIAGILAAIFPARRAAKLNVLDALQYE